MTYQPFFQGTNSPTSPPYRNQTEMFLDSSKTLRKNGGITIFNGGVVVTASGWAPAADGTMRLAQSLSAKAYYIPLTGLKVGDKLSGFRILGQIESAGNTATLDADLRKVTKGAADVTDASVGAITQISVAADTSVDTEKTFTSETVSADFSYYVLVTGTTAASTDIAVVGVEVDISRVL